MKHLLFLLIGCIIIGVFWAVMALIVIIPLGFLIGSLGGVLAYLVGFVVYNTILKRR